MFHPSIEVIRGKDQLKMAIRCYRSAFKDSNLCRFSTIREYPCFLSYAKVLQDAVKGFSCVCFLPGAILSSADTDNEAVVGSGNHHIFLMKDAAPLVSLVGRLLDDPSGCIPPFCFPVCPICIAAPHVSLLSNCRFVNHLGQGKPKGTLWE